MRWLFLLLFTCSFSTHAFGYSIGKVNGSGPIIRWYVKQIPYWIDSQGSADISDGSDIAAVQSGFQQWTNIACSDLKLLYQGLASAKNNMAVNKGPNGKNEVSWAEGSEWIYGNYVLGITQTSFNPQTGEISEADIAFNGYTHKWSTNKKPNTTDVLNVAVHEEGHFVGANHNLGGYDPNNPPTMAPTADPYLNSQTLEDDDKLLACFLYPKGEYTCQNDNQCPYVVDKKPNGQEQYVQKITCINGLCGGVSAQIPEGTKSLGEQCASDFDCIKPLFCQPTGSGSVCAKNCNTDTDCGSGFKCYPYSNGPGGVCLPFSGSGTGPGATKENGAPCNYSEECKSGMCVGFSGSSYCRQPCTPGANQCPAGEACQKLQGSNFGACLPGQGSSGTKPPGSPCSSPAECMSGLCVGNSTPGSAKCRESCTPALSDCPQNYDCVPLQSGGGACIPGNPKKEIGEPCQYAQDCNSNFCLSVVGDNNSYCSLACGNPTDCPCGMKCTVFQGNKSYCTLTGAKNCTPSGNPCQSSAECVSNACVNGVCRDLCKVDGLSKCPPNQACQPNEPNSVNGFCANSGATPVGSPCNNHVNCTTLLCLPSVQGNICVQPCDPASTFCGEGQACITLANTAYNVCQKAPPSPATTTGGGTGATTGGQVDGAGTTDGVDGGGWFGSGSGGGSGSQNGADSDDGESSSGCQSAAGNTSGAPITVMLLLLLVGMLRRFKNSNEHA